MTAFISSSWIRPLGGRIVTSIKRHHPSSHMGFGNYKGSFVGRGGEGRSHENNSNCMKALAICAAADICHANFNYALRRLETASM